MPKGKSKQATKLSNTLSAEPQLNKLDTRSGSLVAQSLQPKPIAPKTLSNVYIGGMDTLSWSQYCHSGNVCHSETWVDTETSLFLYKDKECEKTAGLVVIYNGGRVADNSSLLTTATAAYLAKSPVSLHYIERNEPYARSHGRLNAVIRLWFRRCTPCGCKEE